MRNARPNPASAVCHGGDSRRITRAIFVGVLLLGCFWSGGCAALPNPVADAVPVNRLPPEVLGKRKDEERPIPPTLLRQRPPNRYRLGPGDVLGVFTAGALG